MSIFFIINNKSLKSIFQVTNLFKGGNQSFFSEKEIHRRHPNQKIEEIEVSDDALATSTETSESKNGPPSRAFEGQLTLRMLTCRVVS
jgi:hypothetical protein